MGLFSSLLGGKKNQGIGSAQKDHMPVIRYNKENVYDVSLALSCLVTNADESWLHVVLQDENKEKEWPKVMSVSATVDNWRLEHLGITELHNVNSYRKLEVPEDIAQFLASIPFVTSRKNEIEYKFSTLPEYPSTYTHGVMDSMRKGCSMSKYAMVRDVKIEDRKGFVVCNVG